MSAIGNTIKGLSPSEIEAISKEKLRLNKHFKINSNEFDSTSRDVSNKKTASDGSGEGEQSHQVSENKFH